MTVPLAFGMAGRDHMLLISSNMEKSNSRMVKSMDPGSKFPDLDHGCVTHQLCGFECVNDWVL